MNNSSFFRLAPIFVALIGTLLTPLSPARAEKVFDGRTLTGWTLVGGHGPGYIVENGTIVCPADGGGNLYTEREYSDFHLKFEFKCAPGGNNGVGLRAPLEGDAAYVGMESQILDDDSPMYAKLEPGQYHGSLYKVAAAKRGALKKAGEWNREEIRAIGRRVEVIVNGQKTVDIDLNTITDPKILAEHPGILRQRGHIGFLGHGSRVEFRNIEIRDMGKPERDNVAPKGFTRLFNGRDMTGWKGLVGNPKTRAAMDATSLAKKTESATIEAKKHWVAKNGVVTYDGKNDNLCTEKDYANFELRVDFKIEPGGDSGLYLRGSPQVQIWDRALTAVGAQVGSGGLYNNQKNPSKPLVAADRPIGEWNRLMILMVGERVTVYLNDVLVVKDVVMENYWDRSQPIYPTGAIELQHHGAPLYFKNIYVREIGDRK